MITNKLRYKYAYIFCLIILNLHFLVKCSSSRSPFARSQRERAKSIGSNGVIPSRSTCMAECCCGMGGRCRVVDEPIVNVISVKSGGSSIGSWSRRLICDQVVSLRNSCSAVMEVLLLGHGDSSCRVMMSNWRKSSGSGPRMEVGSSRGDTWMNEGV